MDLPLNQNKPLVMHIDLNSCFATIEQQTHIQLRGKPVVVAAYPTPNGCVVAPSIEAKRYGIKTGMRVRDARLLCKDVIVRVPDPQLYRDVHIRLCHIFRDYSSSVSPKSIDEAVIDFRDTPHLARELPDLAREIKSRIRREIGDRLSCSIGIATNRFLAKTAAGLRKPDGLELIDRENLRAVYARLRLIDLCGINERYQARLNTRGIFSPLQFLDAREDLLRKYVFQSIAGYYWYLRLRGWEVDSIDFARKSFGQVYALKQPEADPVELSRLLMKLCEKMGRRLRRAGYAARGVHVACIYQDWTHWHRGRMMDSELYTTQELYKKVQLVFNQRPEAKPITKLAVSCYDLVKSCHSQLSFFDLEPEKMRRCSDAVDAINDRYGEFVITPAIMLNMDGIILDRIAFGGVRELEDLYASTR